MRNFIRRLISLDLSLSIYNLMMQDFVKKLHLTIAYLRRMLDLRVPPLRERLHLNLLLSIKNFS